jgi:hypothetical protein
LATTGVAAAAMLFLGVPVFAQNGSKPQINPNTGQINADAAPQAQSGDVSNMPTAKEAWSALVQPISRQPSAGGPPAATTGTSGGQQAPTQGANGASSEPQPSGPIGSFGQTIPAKFSKRNDVLDHVPIAAIPLPLTAEQRKQVYDAVMAEKSQPIEGADALKPASELSPDQALNGMRPLPESVRSIDGLSRLYYIRTKDRIFLIEPNVRTVVGEITAS